MNYAEFDVCGKRMRLEAYPAGLKVMLRQRWLWIFWRWETITLAQETAGIKSTYTMFFNEAKAAGKPLLRITGV